MTEYSLIEKLETFYIRFREIGQLITDPEVIQDMNRFVKLNKEYRDLEQVTAAGDELKAAVKSLEEAREILEMEEDKELREMAQAEIEELEAKIPELENTPGPSRHFRTAHSIPAPSQRPEAPPPLPRKSCAPKARTAPNG